MTIQRIITDIPPADLDFVLATVRADGGVPEIVGQSDGNLTVIATFDALQASDEMPEPASRAAAWMSIAHAELGVVEVPGDENNPQIVKYHATTSLGPQPDEVPWCSSFVNYCISKAGLRGTNSAMARSWLDWGKEISDFETGCVVVLKRGAPPRGHVGFFVGEEGNKWIRLLGGNQTNSVRISSFDRDRVIGRRMP